MGKPNPWMTGPDLDNEEALEAGEISIPSPEVQKAAKKKIAQTSTEVNDQVQDTVPEVADPNVKAPKPAPWINIPGQE